MKLKFFSKEKLNDAPKPEKIKAEKLKSATGQKVGRVIVWILIVFLLLRGINSIVKRDNSSDLSKQFSENMTDINNKQQILRGASAFAECFAKEYLTRDSSNNEDYKSRLSHYMPNYISDSDLNILNDGVSQVLDAVSLSDNFYTDHQIDVDVLVRVKYAKSSQSQDGTIKEVYLRVPISENSGKYAVEDIPVFISKPGSANIKVNEYDGDEADEKTKSDINNMLSIFLKTYCEGNQDEISYYMLNPKSNVKGLEGSFTLQNVDEAKVYSLKSGYFCIVNYTIQDTNSKQILKQRIHLNVIKKDNRYYIKDFDVRVGNLK